MKTRDASTWKATASFVHVSERFDCHDIQFSPEGRTIVLTGTRLDVEFLDTASKEPVRSFQGHASAPYDMAFSPDGSLLASAADDGSVKLWDVGSGALAGSFRVAREAGAVRFSPDGTWLVVSVWGKGLEVWAVAG